MDISTIANDIDELASVVCEVVDGIGVRNIVQIIINDSSSYMQAVEHAVLKKYDHSFLFTLCADYCINLILENIAALDHVNEVLMKARRITRFIYSHALPMQLKEHYIPGVPWWLKHGGGTGELQSFACRILSQTCFGASRYNIDKSLSERLHTEARSYPDQEKFRKEEYIYYNLRLRNSVPRLHGPSEGKHGKLGPKLGDWISAENTTVGQHF
ncbi:hypothetical protein PR202_ga14440 [Eleusine coracana subsp. coracana]|uniref:DUF659 domain-containing protein n=1 Tax=Eleusine coracana subsp. coracana TaxID=191504 RepID=A0AAV5CGM0_ELECO|nr:hypothetical protein PR202_ga14440 [Eleusine coracana subsp. coracana]